MHEIHTEIDVDAPPSVVWAVLTDFASYPEWNGRSRVEGRAREGERLTVAPGPDAGGMPTFRPRVLRADGEELVWRGKLYVRGLFDGEHRFAVEPRADGGSRFVQSERFTGLLVRPILRRYGADTLAGFEAFNAALRDRAESPAAADPAPATDAGAARAVRS
jgi:hypothetical protein